MSESVPTAKLSVICDGSCEPMNPGGVATYGWVAMEGTALIAQESGYLGEREGMTNNVAEYYALFQAATWLIHTKRTEEPVVLRSDSQLVVRQLTGEWRINAPNLQLLATMWQEQIAPHCPLVTLEWVPRSLTLQADSLAREAYRTHVSSHGTECVAVGGEKPHAL